jgi:hypothetical protein
MWLTSGVTEIRAGSLRVEHRADASLSPRCSVPHQSGPSHQLFYTLGVNDSDEAIRKAQDFADTSYADAVSRSTKDLQYQLSVQRNKFAAMGSLRSGNMLHATTKLYGKHIDDLVLARVESVLEGYELYNVPLDEPLAKRTINEAMRQKDVLLINAAETVSDVDNRPVVSLVGDGAFLMTGLELLTASQLHLPVMVLVLRDRELAQIAQFQQLALGRKSCSELPDYDLAAICRGVGVEHMVLRRNTDMESVLGQALTMTRAGRPVVVEVAIDYSQKTYFTRGVVRTNLGRLPWPDRIRYVLRALGRRLT